jgi:hypothetical protein
MTAIGYSSLASLPRLGVKSLISTVNPVYDLNMPGIKCVLPMCIVAFATIAVCQPGDPAGLKPKERNGRWGYVDEAGVFVIAPKYFAAQPFIDGFALVVTKKPWSPLGSEYGEFRLAQVTWIDNSGREIHRPISVRSARSFSDGLAAVVPDRVLRLHGGCAEGGYIDAHGNWAIQPKFDAVSDFSEGLAAVNIGAQCGMGGKWGYINKAGSIVISPTFLLAGQFHNGRACVTDESHKNTVIDRTGTILVGDSCP